MLQNRETEFDFVGITSNGIDCIYFMDESTRLNIHFEALTSRQLPFIEKLEDFARANNLKTEITTYNNRPEYASHEPAPVLQIELNASVEQASTWGEKIQREVFGNNGDTFTTLFRNPRASRWINRSRNCF